MTISARLKVAAAVPMLMALAVAGALLLANRTLETSRAQSQRARDLVKAVNEVNSLLHSYLLYYEERPKQQLLEQSAAIMRLLLEMQMADPVQQLLLDDLRTDSESMKATFLRLTSGREKYPDPPADEVLHEAEERLRGQMMARARGLVAQALRLDSMALQRSHQAQQRLVGFAIALLFVTTVPVTALLLVLRRNIVASLARLREGAETLARQELSHRIAAPRVDELGELAAAFDDMARRLEESTVSRNALAEEVEERKRAESALREAQEKLEQHAEELEQIVARRTARLQETVDELEHFSYAIVHDLRAPLRAMQGFAALIEEECDVQAMPLSREYLRRIKNASNRMDQLITDALNYSKAAHAELTMEKVDAHALVRDLVDTYPNLQPDRADISVQGRLPVIHGNEAALTQCLSNLLGNAVKFARKGSRPKIKVWSEDVPDAENLSGLKPMVRIWIEDDGIGIPPEALKRIFGMFQRATVEHEGTGVGLAIVRKVAQRMGGDVGVESEVGKGSRFWVLLPRA